MSTPNLNTDVTEQASMSKEKADEIVDKRGKTNSVVWKWFGFLRSDKLQVSVSMPIKAVYLKIMVLLHLHLCI